MESSPNGLIKIARAIVRICRRAGISRYSCNEIGGPATYDHRR